MHAHGVHDKYTATCYSCCTTLVKYESEIIDNQVFRMLHMCTNYELP